MSNTKLTTGVVRLSYAHIFEPKAMDAESAPKYSGSLIIDKGDTQTIRALEQAIVNAMEEGKSKKFGGKTPLVWKNPMRDGDLERPDDEAYAGSVFINASSNRQPGVVDLSLNKILDPEEVYSGCYVRANINCFAFNKNGNRGVAVGLNHIQKVRDGERLGGVRSSAEEAFNDDYDPLLD